MYIPCSSGIYMYHYIMTEERRMNIQDKPSAHQEIKLYNREKLTVTGVEDVASFDENTIIIKSNFGMLAVDGRALRIASLSTETGELFVEGEIGGVVFFDENQPKKKRGLFAK